MIWVAAMLSPFYYCSEIVVGVIIFSGLTAITFGVKLT